MAGIGSRIATFETELVGLTLAAIEVRSLSEDNPTRLFVSGSRDMKLVDSVSALGSQCARVSELIERSIRCAR